MRHKKTDTKTLQKIVNFFLRSKIMVKVSQSSMQDAWNLICQFCLTIDAKHLMRTTPYSGCQTPKGQLHLRTDALKKTNAH